MKHMRRFTHLLLVLTLCLTLLPLPVSSASNIYLTSINDNLLPLTSSTMPFWSGSILYVPASVFDSSSPSTGLGLSCSYNRDRSIVSIYSQDLSNPHILVFDLASGTIQDDMKQKSVPGRAVMRNGRPFLPISVVCTFFGLSYSYNRIPTVERGYLVRIKSDAVVLSDALFMDAGKNLIDRRIQEFNQSLAPSVPNPAPTLPPNPNPLQPPAAADPDDPGTGVTTYLAFTCRSDDGVANILDTLEHNNEHALFLVTADLLKTNSQLVRRMVGSGHVIGLLAEGETWQESQAALNEAQTLLEQLTFTHATAAFLPPDQKDEAEASGWVCWTSTLSLFPSASASSSTFSANTLRRLKGRTKSTYLSLPADLETARVLPTFLRELKRHHFDPVPPLETRL